MTYEDALAVREARIESGRRQIALLEELTAMARGDLVRYTEERDYWLRNREEFTRALGGRSS